MRRRTHKTCKIHIGQIFISNQETLFEKEEEVVKKHNSTLKIQHETKIHNIRDDIGYKPPTEKLTGTLIDIVIPKKTDITSYYIASYIKTKETHLNKKK